MPLLKSRPAPGDSRSSLTEGKGFQESIDRKCGNLGGSRNVGSLDRLGIG